MEEFDRLPLLLRRAVVCEIAGLSASQVDHLAGDVLGFWRSHDGGRRWFRKGDLARLCAVPLRLGPPLPLLLSPRAWIAITGTNHTDLARALESGAVQCWRPHSRGDRFLPLTELARVVNVEITLLRSGSAQSHPKALSAEEERE